MWLRWVVSNLLNQVAEDKVRQVVTRAKQLVTSPRAADSGASREVPADDPPCDIVLLFALGLESGGFVDQLQNVVTTECSSYLEHAGDLGEQRVVVADSGVGREAAAQATEDLIKIHHPEWVVSAGFAGALDDRMRRGHILMADEVVDEKRHPLTVGFKIDPRVIQATPSLHVGRLLTVDQLIRSGAEKRNLAAAFGAVACDMETMAVAQACRRRQVRFMSVRVVSDELEDTLPAEVEHLLDQTSLAGKLGAATRAVFQRPRSLKDMWRLRETALRASDRLAKFLQGVIPQLK